MPLKHEWAFRLGVLWDRWEKFPFFSEKLTIRKQQRMQWDWLLWGTAVVDGRGHMRLRSAWVSQPRWADCWSRSSLGQYEELLMRPLHPCGSWPWGSFQQLHLGHRLGLLHLVTLVPQWSIRDSQSTRDTCSCPLWRADSPQPLMTAPSMLTSWS